MNVCFFGTVFVKYYFIEEKIKRKTFLKFMRYNNTSQRKLYFFHKFGLVRFSLNPGAEAPGFFILYILLFEIFEFAGKGNIFYFIDKCHFLFFGKFCKRTCQCNFFAHERCVLVTRN